MKINVAERRQQEKTKQLTLHKLNEAFVQNGEEYLDNLDACFDRLKLLMGKRSQLIAENHELRKQAIQIKGDYEYLHDQY